MPRKTRTPNHDDDYKRGVVSQLRAGQYSRTEIANAHHVTMNTLRNWEVKFAAEQNLPPAQPLPIRQPQAIARGKVSQSRAPMAARRSGTTSPDLANINQEIADTQRVLEGLLLRRAAAELSIQ